MPTKQKALTLVELLVVIGIIGLLIALLLPQVRSAGEAARRNQCMNNIKQISLALLSYESTHGNLPPAYTVDEKGNRLHSWRTLILPYIEQQALYDSIDLNKPWDHPANAAARETIVELYLCPSSAGEELETTYYAVIGADCAFTGETGRQLSEVKDDLANTIFLVDIRTDRTIHWMSPEDVSPEQVLAIDSKKASYHPGVFVAAYLDGHAEGIDSDIDREVLRSMLTIAGGEAAEE